jgi:hypothetical protein
MPPEQSTMELLAVLTRMEYEYGKQAALVTQALASLQFSIEHTRELIELAQVGDEGAQVSAAIWQDAQDRITEALTAPLLDGLDPTWLQSCRAWCASAPSTSPAAR